MLVGSWAQNLVLLCAVCTIVFGSARALRTAHLKRRLAYSTVSNLSYMLLGVCLMTPAGLSAALLHMVVHAVSKITLFFCAGAIYYKSGKEYVYELAGFGRRMPVVLGCFLVTGLCLMGIPPLAGFSSKWMLAAASAGLGWRWQRWSRARPLPLRAWRRSSPRQCSPRSTSSRSSSQPCSPIPWTRRNGWSRAAA